MRHLLPLNESGTDVIRSKPDVFVDPDSSAVGRSLYPSAQAPPTAVGHAQDSSAQAIIAAVGRAPDSFSIFEDYFARNWDSCPDLCCSYTRQNAVTMGNNMNNHLEAFWKQL